MEDAEFSLPLIPKNNPAASPIMVFPPQSSNQDGFSLLVDETYRADNSYPVWHDLTVAWYVSGVEYTHS